MQPSRQAKKLHVTDVKQKQQKKNREKTTFAIEKMIIKLRHVKERIVKHETTTATGTTTRVRRQGGHTVEKKKKRKKTGGHTNTHESPREEKKNKQYELYGVLVCCWLASSLPDRTSFPVFAASSNQSVQVDSGRSGGASLCP